MQRGCLAGLAALVLLSSAACQRDRSNPTVEDVVEAAGGRRPVEPRLSGGFSDAPCCSPVPEAALRKVLDRLRSQGGEVPAAVHHARGMALLVGPGSKRFIDLAISDLSAAAHLEPRGCRWNDLAAGYIVRARVRDDPRDLVRALSAVVRAEVSGTCAAEARFNRALILKRLWLDGEGREIARTSPQEVREHAYEELLGRWGEAILAGRLAKAEEALNRADAVGGALRESGGDETLADAVDSIRESGSVEELARGHRAYRDGIELFRRLDFEAAGPRFAEARERFERAGSPAQLWAEVGAAGLDLYAGRYEKAIRGFREIDRRADPKRHCALRGRARWGLGMAYARQGLWAESVRPYEEAASHFAAAREQENLGASWALLAEALRFLGQADAAWRARARAFREFRRFPVSRRLHNLLWESADSCLDEGEPEAALVLQDEGVKVAERTGDPVILAEALVRRSRVLLERGDTDGAWAELREARVHNEKGKGAATRGRIAADIDYAQGEILRRSRPEWALEPLGRAVKDYGRRKLPLNLAAALLSRARAHLSLEHGEEAEADLAAAIDLFERQQLALRDDSLRLSFLDTAQGLFDEMILLQVRIRKRPLVALEFSERSRAVLLSEARPSLNVGRIPDHVTLVEYGLVRNHLFIWIIRREGVEFVERTLDPAAFELQVRHFLKQVRRGAEAGSAALGEILLPPAVREGNGDLFFIPDKILNEIPFAALRNGGRYLVEDRAVGVMPSLSFFVRTPERPMERFSVLLVGNPLFDRQRFPSMPNLAEAEAEVESIEPFYPDAEVLAGAGATRERLLAGLGRHSVLHYAGHALFNPRDPASSYLLLARSAGGPDVLYARDLAGLRLRHLRLAVLSACETMAPLRTRNGKLAGLVRPLLSAGVPAVLGALWDVDDRATRVLLSAFHRRLAAGGDPVRALREAQVEMLASPEPSLRSPGSWAGFQLIGR